jgi:hypothetical protein
MQNQIITTKLNKKKLIDAGMAFVLLALLMYFIFHLEKSLQVAVILILITMIVPVILYPFAILWYSLSNLLGSIVSKILLSVVFILIVCPVGLFRKLSKDSLRLKQFKRSGESVFLTRNQLFTVKDLKYPF